MTVLVDDQGQILVTDEGRELRSDGPFQKSPTGRNTIATASVPFATFGGDSLQLLDGLTISYTEIFRTQPAVAAAVNKLTRQISSLPLKVYRLNSQGERERVRDHALVALLRHPAPRCGPIQFMQWVILPALLHGNAALAKGRKRSGQPPSHIWPLDWRCMAPRVESGRLMFWQTAEFGETMRLDPADVFHFGWEAPDGLVGVSPLQQLGVTVRIERSAQDYQESYLKQGARPPSAITMPEGTPGGPGVVVDKDLRAEMRADIEATYAGSSNAGRPAFLPGGFKWETIAHNAHEAELIEQRRISRNEVASVFDVPPPLLGDLDKATFCLPADALVSTERGPLPITAVEAGDRVWSVRDGKLDLAPVAWSGQTGTKPLLTIKTQNRTLRCTDNHPVLVARSRDASTRRTNNQHRSSREPGYHHEWVAAGDLAAGDLIVTLSKLPDHGIRSCPTREQVSPKFAEFCGLLMGDGTVNEHAVSVARANDARYMDHYRESIVREFESYDGGNQLQAVRERCPVRLQEGERQTRFSSVLAARELRELGLAGTARTKRIPEWVFLLTPDLRAAFLRGFCDADGSVDKRGHMTVTLANETMLRQIREMFIGLGVPVCNIGTSRKWVTLPTGDRFFSVAWTFKASNPAANAAIIGSHDPQDRERMAAGKPWGRKAYRYPNRIGELPPAIDGCGHARVVSIEVGDVGVPVYDLTVPGSHNFVAEGVVVHNSNITEQHKMLFTTNLRPWLTLVEESIQAQIIDPEPAFQGHFVEFDLAEVLRGDKKAEVDALTTAVQAGLMTLNEARQTMNLATFDEEWCDRPLIPANNLRSRPEDAGDAGDEPARANGATVFLNGGQIADAITAGDN